jgi:hypothetical protein
VNNPFMNPIKYAICPFNPYGGRNGRYKEEGNGEVRTIFQVVVSQGSCGDSGRFSCDDPIMGQKRQDSDDPNSGQSTKDSGGRTSSNTGKQLIRILLLDFSIVSGGLADYVGEAFFLLCASNTWTGMTPVSCP